MAFLDGFDVPRVSQDLASNYSSSGGVKSYAPGVVISSHPVDLSTPYTSSAAPKSFSPGFITVAQMLNTGTIYLEDSNRYKIFAYRGAVEASTLSRLLRPGDNGVDISWLNLEEQKQTVIQNY